MKLKIIDRGISYYVEIRDMPDENGEMMLFVVECIDLAPGAEYEDIIKVEELYDAIIERLVEGEL